MKNEPHIKVQEVMTRNVRTIDRMAPVRDAMNEMKEYGFSSLIVDRRDVADEYGVIAITDIVYSQSHIELRSGLIFSRNVADISTRNNGVSIGIVVKVVRLVAVQIFQTGSPLAIYPLNIQLG